MKLNRIIFGLLIAAAGLTACASNTSSDASATAEAKPAAAQAAKAAAAKVEKGVKIFRGNRITPDAKLPMVIDFNATWCGPCRQFAPIFHAAAEKYAGKAVFVSVDVDQSPEAAMQFEVSSIPQVTVLMPDGKTKSTVGYMNEGQFAQFLKDAAGVK